MRHTLKLHGVVVGWSDLEEVEPGLGRARGRFRPAIGYELVQPIFRLYAEAVPRSAETRDEAKLARYYKSRDALQLELVDDTTGRRISTSAIHIADYRNGGSGGDDCELDVLIADIEYWERRGTSR
jgi:hypothetical protein